MTGLRIVLPRQTEPRLIPREGAPAAGVRLKTFGTVGPQGQPGPVGQVASHVHPQAQPATTWTVNHNLGRKPIVSLLTVGGVEIFGHVTHVSDAQFTASFAVPTAGQAICL